MKKLILTLGLLATATYAFAISQVVKPYTFVEGTRAKSSEVNANFDTVYSGTNAAISALNAAAGVKSSVNERISVSLTTSGILKNHAFVTPQEYGGIPGDSVGDSDALNNALATGKMVFLSSGTWLIDKTISVPSGGAIIGSGNSSILVVPDTGFVGERVITNSDISTGNTNITLSGFSIRVTTDLPVTGVNPGIIRFHRVTGLNISNISTDSFNSQYTVIDLVGGIRRAKVQGCNLKNDGTTSGGAVWVRSGIASNPSVDNSYDIVIEGNHMEAAGDEAFTLMGWANDISNVTVTNNSIVNTSSTKPACSVFGEISETGGTVNNVVLSGNAIRGKLSIGSKAKYVNVVGNEITSPTAGATMDGVFIAKSYVAGSNPEYITVSSNIVIGPGAAGTSRHGIYIGGNNCVISNNSVYDAKSIGIYSPIKSIITGNKVFNSGGSNYAIETSYCIVKNNYSYGAQNGISLSNADFSNSLISNNVIEEPSTTGIYLAYSGSITNLTVDSNEVRNVSSTMTRGIWFNTGTYTGLVDSNKVFGALTTNMVLPATMKKVNNYVTTSMSPFPANSGISASRPTEALGTTDRGFVYYDTTLDADGLPITWNGTKWIKSDGSDA